MIFDLLSTKRITDRLREIGTKVIRGMTEYPNETFCSTQFYNQIKRELTNSASWNSDVAPFIHTNGNDNGNDACPNQLTESKLKYNVQIVLDNLKRSADKTYLNDKKNNNKSVKNSGCNGNGNGNGNSNLSKNAKKYLVGVKMSSPESDCNSNPHINPLQQLVTSIASSHDFTHDNSDYQWFLDYNYRENNVTHQSVLSSLSASYNGIGELSYYEDLAKNIDANLAGVDMESFHAEDINLLLSTIPTICKSNAKKRQEKELDNSIFKSKQLFSPVKESMLSVDSLDMDCYTEDCDMIITCQANKNNYTIAFEGSTMYSDDSFYGECGPNREMPRKLKDDNGATTSIDDIVKKKALEVSLCRSESGFTTWSKLKKNSSTQLHRYPSGNNNTSVNVGVRQCIVRKSSSLPNLQVDSSTTSYGNEAISNSTIDSYGKLRTLLPMCLMPDSSSQSESPQPLQNSTSSNGPQPSQPSFNLVKLFIKQKSSSTDTCMDVSSGCWPSDSSSSVEHHKQRKKSMYDSGKGSALSKQEEDTHEAEIQYDSLDLPPPQPIKSTDNISSPKRQATQSNDLYREVFDSPSHRKYKECNLNIRNQHLANVNNNNSMDRDSLKETMKSISDASRTSDNITQVYAKTKLPLEMITKSMQTSMMKESVKVVPPSFLAQLNQNSKASEPKQAPVYVIYPNYALPDLGFVKNFQSQVVLSPLGLKETFAKKRRPMSTADIEYIKKREYQHIADWKSLAPLLPFEYKKLLQHIPEVQNVVKDPKMSQKPLFCMSPPIRRNRPVSCDCSTIYTNSSSGSGSSQPPSSGYKGSSTMLTDSEYDVASNSGNNNRTQDETIGAAELPPTGFIRRGILRRTNSSKSKRNSMVDETNSYAAINNRLKMEKRCSVQDPYYAPGNDTTNVQYYPYPSDIFDMNVLKNNFGEQTKEQLTIEHKEYDDEARSRVEHFLSNVPKSELKYYAEIANILESIENISDIYDRNKLKNEVSRALAQKHVSFDRDDSCQYLAAVNNNDARCRTATTGRAFTTPPNSPNISISAARGNLEQQQKISKKSKQEKIQSNRFKRLQIQWELLSKDAQQMESELFKETRSGGTTPTTTQIMTPRSRIPRPVSYPAAKASTTSAKSSPSPSRMTTPKRVVIAPSTTPVSRPRTPNKLHNTPKKASPIVKTGSRISRPC